jgi:uncharacterized membrane protein
MIPSTSTHHRSADARAGLVAAAVSLLVSILIVAPFFHWGSASGHDFEFHVSSWLDVAGQWNQGIVFPRWTEWANHGFGEPRFIFYPPLSWMLAPALHLLVRWTYVPVLFIVLVQVFAGIAAFVFARRLLPPGSAIFAAVVYAANPNALLIIYMRSDFAELLASAFFPLLFLSVLRLTGLVNHAETSKIRAVVAFALTFAAVWLSNAPAGVLATYSMVLLFAWAAWEEKSWKPLGHGAAAMALGFGLAAFYLVPAAYEQRWVNISQVLSAGLLPSQNFLYTMIDDPEHNLFNWIASTSAILLMVVTGIAALAVSRQGREAGQPPAADATKTWRVLLLVAAAATLMMLKPTAILWNLLPKLRFVQFPWRWMSILAVAFAWFVAAAISRSRQRWLWVGAMVILLSATGTFFVHNTWWDSDDVPSLQFGMTHDQGFEGTDEYDPVGDDHFNLPIKAPPRATIVAAADGSPIPKAAKVLVERWTAEQRVIRVETPEAVRLALRLLNYPAWRIELNNTIVSAQPPTDTNQMIISVPAGQSVVCVRFLRTPDRTVGLLVSLLSALIAVALWMVARPSTRLPMG